MKKTVLLSFALLVSAVFLGGCASSGPERDIEDPTNSLVFGYIDMEDAPTGMDYARLKQVQPPTEYPYWSMGVNDGLMFQQFVAPGSYQMSQFGGSSFFGGPHDYMFPQYGKNQTALRIDAPGIYFIGAFRYKEVDTGFFEQGKFEMESVKSPSERELLERLAKMDWVEGTQWEARIKARLAELK